MSTPTIITNYRVTVGKGGSGCDSMSIIESGCDYLKSSIVEEVGNNFTCADCNFGLIVRGNGCVCDGCISKEIVREGVTCDCCDSGEYGLTQ